MMKVLGETSVQIVENNKNMWDNSTCDEIGIPDFNMLQKMDEMEARFEINNEKQFIGMCSAARERDARKRVVFREHLDWNGARRGKTVHYDRYTRR